MYQGDRKRSFIDSKYKTLNSRNNVEALFNRTEPFEVRLGKDLCAFSVEEATSMISKMTTAKSDTVTQIICYLRKYAAWCKEQGFADANLVLPKIKADLTEAMRRSRVQGPLQLQRYLNACYTPEDEETADLVSRGFAWLAFMGVPSEVIPTIRSESVDLNSWFLYNGDTRYKIPDEAHNVFQKLVMLDSMNYTHSGYGTIRRKRLDNPYLLRTFKGAISRRALDFLLSNGADKANESGASDLRLTYTDLFLSGLYYRMYQEECVSPPISFQRYASIAMESNGPKKIPSVQQRIARERNLKKDYENWKKVFNL